MSAGKRGGTLVQEREERTWTEKRDVTRPASINIDRGSSKTIELTIPLKSREEARDHRRCLSDELLPASWQIFPDLPNSPSLGRELSPYCPPICISVSQPLFVLASVTLCNSYSKN